MARRSVDERERTPLVASDSPGRMGARALMRVTMAESAVGAHVNYDDQFSLGVLGDNGVNRITIQPTRKRPHLHLRVTSLGAVGTGVDARLMAACPRMGNVMIIRLLGFHSFRRA